MGKLRGYVPSNQKQIVRCKSCMRKFTKFMAIQIDHYRFLYKCIRCYNGGNK